MGIFFRLAFSNLYDTDNFSALKVAVKNNDYNQDQYFSHAIAALNENQTDNSVDESNTSSKKILAVSYVKDFEAANLLLENKSVIGIIEVKNQNPILNFKTSGTKETILKKIIEAILDKRTIYNNAFSEIRSQVEQNIKSQAKNQKQPNYSQLKQQAYQKISKQLENKIQDLSKNTVEFNSLSSKKLDLATIEYFSLIAMACLSGAYISMFTINSILANMSEHGKRVATSPVKKRTLILSGLLSAFLTHLTLLLLIFLFNILILQIDYGGDLPHIIFISVCGSFAGLSLGLCIGSLIKAPDMIKVNIITFIYLFCCFLSGMMGPPIKYLVDSHASLINLINPANMIVDGLYSLNIYDTFDRFNFNLLSLLIFSFICIILSITVIRKQKYKYL